jgi:mRNA interferase MazF
MDFIELLKEWFKLKIALWNKKDNIVFKQGDLWWCSLGINLGEEIFGKGEKFTRPVLIFKKFTGNSFLGLPLTIQEKKGSWYVKVETAGVKRSVMLNQARILDKKRLTNRIGAVSGADFKEIKRRFLEFYGS